VAAGGARTTYLYDPFGLLVGWDGPAGDTARFQYADGQIVRDRQGATTRALVPGEGLAPLAVITGGVEHTYIEGHGDHIAAALDANGALVERYETLGNVAPSIWSGNGTMLPTSGIGSRMLLGGQPWSPQLLSHRQGQRWYRPDWGRFLSPDPLGFADGPNVYAYGRMNAARWTDPSGLLSGPAGPDLIRNPLGSYGRDTLLAAGGYGVGVAKVLASPGVVTYYAFGSMLYEATDELQYLDQHRNFVNSVQDVVERGPIDVVLDGITDKGNEFADAIDRADPFAAGIAGGEIATTFALASGSVVDIATIPMSATRLLPMSLAPSESIVVSSALEVPAAAALEPVGGLIAAAKGASGGDGKEAKTDATDEPSEHTKNMRNSTKSKHEKGQARGKRDRGGEKGDSRRPKWK